MSYASDVDQALREGVVALVEPCFDQTAVTPGHVAQERLFELLDDEAVSREILTYLRESPFTEELSYLEIGAVLDGLKWVLKGE